MSPPAPAVIRGLDDILAIEQEPLASRQPPESTFALIREAARRHGDAPALSFFLDGLHPERASRYSYRQLYAEVCRCANLFDELGLAPDQVVAYILPNLPETHFVLWGGEASGIVFAINPLLDAGQMVELMAAAETQSRAMAAKNKLDHDVAAPFGKRVKASGFNAAKAVENISAGYHTMAEAFSGWRDSPSHRANMLASGVTKMGIAAVYAPNSKYKVFWTMILAAPDR